MLSDGDGWSGLCLGVSASVRDGERCFCEVEVGSDSSSYIQLKLSAAFLWRVK